MQQPEQPYVDESQLQNIDWYSALLRLRDTIHRSDATQPKPVSTKGCKFDTDGDGNCPRHRDGCPEELRGGK
jgi:hypothetical protein